MESAASAACSPWSTRPWSTRPSLAPAVPPRVNRLASEVIVPVKGFVGEFARDERVGCEEVLLGKLTHVGIAEQCASEAIMVRTVRPAREMTMRSRTRKCEQMLGRRSIGWLGSTISRE